LENLSEGKVTDMKRILEIQYVLWFCFVCVAVSGCSSINKNHPEVGNQDHHIGAESGKTAYNESSAEPVEALRAEDEQYVTVTTPFGQFKNPVLPKNDQVTLQEKSLNSQSLDMDSDVKNEEKEAPPTIQNNQFPRLVKNKEKPEVAHEETGGELVLNFDNADLYEVVRTFAEVLKMDFIFDAPIKGNVDIYTTGKIKKKDLMPIFFQILEINGLTALKDGRFYRIIPLKDASRLSESFQFGFDHEGLSPDERIVIQIIALKYISPGEMSKLLSPFISSTGSILLHEMANTLILIDKATMIPKVQKLVDAFDVDFFERYHHRLFTINYVDVEEFLKSLQTILATYEETKQGKLELIPLTRINTILAISKNPRLLEKIEELKKILDIPGDDVEPKIYVYNVKNSEAGDLGSLLQSVFGKSREDKNILSKKDAEPKSDDKPSKMNTPLGRPDEKILSGNSGAGLQFDSGTLRKNITITADQKRNALIIEAIPSDYRIITDLLNKIDTLPRQVLIEVTIAEVSLDDTMDMGVEWTFKENGEQQNPITATIGGAFSEAVTGLDYTMGLTEKWNAKLHALASQQKANVLSAPSIMATDNKSATINISDSIPVISSEYQSATNDVIQTNVSYKETGIMLTVTPHINEGGLVTMDVQQEVSNQVQGTSGANPSFRQRIVNTSLTVKNGQTIVIGGLMRETGGTGKTGVPVLSKLPLVGFLFGFDSTSSNKTELILFLTPRVIVTSDDVDYLTSELKGRINVEKMSF